MLARIIKPYRVSVSELARAAGFQDQNFSSKKAARAFVRLVQKVDPAFNPTLRLTFRYYDAATGALYSSRFEYETEEARRRDWLEQFNAQRTAHPNP